MNKEEKKQYMREWHLKNKEKVNARSRQFYIDHPTYRKEYYETNKERIYEKQKEYIKKNRKKITQQILENRKKKAQMYKEQGQMFCYYSKTKRQNKMVEYLCKKTNLSEEESRVLLERYNWNIKQIIKEVM